MGVVVVPLLIIVTIIHGAFGLSGIRYLINGFNLAKTRKDILSVSLIAMLAFICTMAAWGLGTTLFDRKILAFTVGFGYLFLAMVFLFFFLPLLFSTFGQKVAHGVKAGVGLAIPSATLYYMIYMFYIPH